MLIPLFLFEVDTPPVDKIPVEPIGNLQPDMVFQLALANLPQQKVNKLRLEAAQKYVQGARGAMYPTISAFGNLGASYNNKAQEVTGSSTFVAPLGKVNVGGTNYDVFPNQPFTSYTYGKMGYFSQLNQNFRQSLGIQPERTYIKRWLIAYTVRKKQTECKKPGTAAGAG